MRRSMAFDPQKSQINTETMSDFLRAELSLELTDVPGIGDKTKSTLVDNGIRTAHQLLGLFLMLGSNPHALFDTLKSMNVSANKSTIVHALATKADVFLPGTYDAPSDVEEEDEGYLSDEDTQDDESAQRGMLASLIARLRGV